jgi:hypothetical protein
VDKVGLVIYGVHDNENTFHHVLAVLTHATTPGSIGVAPSDDHSKWAVQFLRLVSRNPKNTRKDRTSL